MPSRCACGSGLSYVIHEYAIFIEFDANARFPDRGYVRPYTRLGHDLTDDVHDSVHSEDQVVIIIATQLDCTAIGEEPFIGLVIQRINTNQVHNCACFVLDLDFLNTGTD